ncbi:type VI secretion system contractile sheath small subunit [Salmonella enterica subsp. enterica serovar Lexington]|nr:type VI secretion system contractile sheath small subunit [Salmonella enterica subsp. enterica serovar Lexington]
MSKDYNGSVAPKERINISYIPKTDGEPSEVELPLNMLIVGDTGNSQETAPLDERQMVSIDKHSFNSVMAEASISLNFAVPASLKDDAKDGDEMNISLEIKSLNDFSPDSVAKQVPELNKLLENEESREQLLREISQAENQ